MLPNLVLIPGCRLFVFSVKLTVLTINFFFHIYGTYFMMINCSNEQKMFQTNRSCNHKPIRIDYDVIG